MKFFKLHDSKLHYFSFIFQKRYNQIQECMTSDKLKCCRHHTIVESDLTAKHLEWQIAKKKKIKDKDCILTHPFTIQRSEKLS